MFNLVAVMYFVVLGSVCVCACVCDDNSGCVCICYKVREGTKFWFFFMICTPTEMLEFLVVSIIENISCSKVISHFIEAN